MDITEKNLVEQSKGLKGIKEKYKSNPAWYWLLATVFLFFILPEYISPFILFVAYIIFKRQWTREGRLAKVGTTGKMEMGLMVYMLVSTLWSSTKLDTLGCAGLWWAVILMQIMIYNLARTKERIKKVISVFVAAASANGIIGAIQFITYCLYMNSLIPKSMVLTTPLYRKLDQAIYGWMPFQIKTDMWEKRASGCFSNPNLLATFMIAAYPLAIYLLLNASSKKSKWLYFLAVVAISCGMASTLTRAGCLIILAAWIFLFVMQAKRHYAKMFMALIPTALSNIPALLVRYEYVKLYPGKPTAEATLSSEVHFDIWKSMIDYLTHHIRPFLIGMGFGCEETGNVLRTIYDLDKPHSHNFIIEIWAELGIIGIIALAIVMANTMGKLLEINSNSKKKITLVFAVSTSFVSYFVFGLSDYIFNSPKQIAIMMILIGLTQAISYTYDKTLINNPHDLEHVIEQNWKNIIHQ